MSKLDKIVMNIKKLAKNTLNKQYYFKALGRNEKVKKDSVLILIQDMERMGSEVLALNIAKEFSRQGINFCVISYSVGPMYADFVSVGPVIICPERRIKKIARFLSKRYGCNKIICNTVVCGTSTGVFKSNGYRVVSLIHELKQSIISNGYEMKCIEIAKSADYIVFPSKFGYSDFCSIIQSESIEKKHIIRPQGLYLTKDFKFDPDICKEIRKKYSISFNKKVVINVATANERKGIDLFLNVTREAIEIDENIEFIWVGDRAEEYLKREIEVYGKNVFRNLLLPGYISNIEDLSYMYYIADLLMLTSREEPFGSIVLEAFSASTPVIAFRNCGGYMDVVKDGETGHLVTPFNTKEMLNSVVSLLNDNDMLKKLSDNCKAEARKYKFDEYCKYIYELTSGIDD